jgi:two-component system, LytTR family, response regulator
MPFRALLVDDERLARKQLRTLLAAFPEVEIVAEAAAVPDALAAVQKHALDVVFLDIQMPGASGFDFLESAEGRFATIFITAHDRFALRAFEVNGLDYLLKPIESLRLARAIRRLSLGEEVATTRPAASLESSDYLFVTSSSCARFVQVKKIQYVLAAGAYSEIFVDDGSKWMVLRSIKEWHARLPQTQFARIHRSTIVNLDFVDRIDPLPNYSYSVLVRQSKRGLVMSRRRALWLKERLA